MTEELDYAALDYSADPRVKAQDDGEFFLSRGTGDDLSRWAMLDGELWNVVGSPSEGQPHEILGSFATLGEAIYAVLGPPASLIDVGDGRHRMHLACELDSDDPSDHIDLIVEPTGRIFTAHLEHADYPGPASAYTAEEAASLFFR